MNYYKCYFIDKVFQNRFLGKRASELHKLQWQEKERRGGRSVTRHFIKCFQVVHFNNPGSVYQQSTCNMCTADTHLIPNQSDSRDRAQESAFITCLQLENSQCINYIMFFHYTWEHLLHFLDSFGQASLILEVVSYRL